jgi:predicted phage gp36 major capsid-like protein
MAVETNADEYRKKADEMKAQAQRAETVYLQALYASIADNWERLAAQMQAADRAHGGKAQQEDDDAPPEDPPPPGLNSHGGKHLSGRL